METNSDTSTESVFISGVVELYRSVSWLSKVSLFQIGGSTILYLWDQENKVLTSTEVSWFSEVENYKLEQYQNKVFWYCVPGDQASLYTIVNLECQHLVFTITSALHCWNERERNGLYALHVPV